MLSALLIALAQAADAAPKPITELPALVKYAQAISPDHSRMAVSTMTNGVWIIRMRDAALVAGIEQRNAPVAQLAWRLDGSELVLCGSDSSLAATVRRKSTSG